MMRTEKDGEATAARRPGRASVLWLGLLLPLGAWMIQLFALYMLEDFISCTPGSRTPGLILGLGIKPIALGITAILGSLTMAAGVASYAVWKGLGPGSEPDSFSAQRWMALAGVMNSALFTLIIVIKAAPPLIIGVCQSPL